MNNLGVSLVSRPLQVGDVVAIACGEAPDRALRRMVPAIQRDDCPVAGLKDVVLTGPDLPVWIWSAKGAIDFLRRRVWGEGCEVGPCAGINQGPVALSAERCIDAEVPAVAGEDDAAYKGVALHLVAFEFNAHVLDNDRDLLRLLAGGPALSSHLFLAGHLKATLGVPRRMVGPVFDAELSMMLVVTHPDAEAARKRVEPLDQRGLGLTGFGALAKLGHKRGKGVLKEGGPRWGIPMRCDLLHAGLDSKQTMSQAVVCRRLVYL